MKLRKDKEVIIKKYFFYFKGIFTDSTINTIIIQIPVRSVSRPCFTPIYESI